MFADFNWIEAMRTSPVMLIILACSVLTAAFALERLIYFGRRHGNPEAILAKSINLIQAGNWRGVASLLASSSHPVGPVASQVLASAHLGSGASEEKLFIALSEERLKLERNLGVLGTMGNTAPLIGLLGTVWGIMRAFHDMASTGSAGPSVVAAGVAEALFTTAAGLLVAVPAVILFNHFSRRVDVMLTVAENHARTIRLALENAGGTAAHSAAPASAPASRGRSVMGPAAA